MLLTFANVIDNYRHKGLRKKLLKLLEEKGIFDQRVLTAMDNVPRHLFLDNAFLELAYEDKAFPIGEGQTISQPYTVAFQTQLLELEKGMKVLEIGTGSGYQTAVLCEMGCKVYSIERQKKLYDSTRILLEKFNYRCKLYYGDGYAGKKAFAPFDRIIVTCGAPEVPLQLLNQLSIGGIIVIPVGNEVQNMLKLRRTEAGIEEESHGDFRFVPMLQNKNR